MIPNITIFNASYRALADAKRVGNQPLAAGHSADGADLLPGELSFGVPFSKQASSSFAHFFVINRVSPQVQMIRPNARRVIAPMQNVFAFGDESKVEEPGNSMGTNFAVHVASAPYFAVAIPADISSPNPTRPQLRPDNRSVFVYFGPESGFYRRAEAHAFEEVSHTPQRT